MLQSLLGGGGAEGGIGLCEVFFFCVIRSEFSPMAIDTFTSRRKLNITVLEGVYVYKVYRDSQNLSSDPTFAHGTWHIHIPSERGICCSQQSIKGDQKCIKCRKKISWCYNRGITHSRVTFNSLENLVPAQVSVQRRTESHKKQSNTTQQNGTEMETN